MAMKFAARRLRTVGAEAGTGRHRSFPADLSDGSCRTDFSDYPRHTPNSYGAQRGTRAHFSRHFRHQDDVLYNSEHTTLKRWPRLLLDTSLAGRVPQGGKVARTQHGTLDRSLTSARRPLRSVSLWAFTCLYRSGRYLAGRAASGLAAFFIWASQHGNVSAQDFLSMPSVE
jgi:hypothetical protein